MLRSALTLVILTFSLAAALGAQVDPTGAWRVEGRSNITQALYAGEVTIARNGECYDVAWSLESGERYRGLGMVVDDAIFAVAWGGDGSNGVVYYLGSSSRDAEWFGWWCQPNGRMGRENLGAPAALDGTHPLTGGDSGTGTVTFTPVPKSETNYTIRWETPNGGYAGFGTRVDRSIDILGGFWGSSQGGVSLFGLGDLDKGSMAGVWALMGETGQGGEVLTRR